MSEPDRRIELNSTGGFLAKPGCDTVVWSSNKDHAAPMNKDDVITALKAAEPELRAQGVAHAALFGSVARGEAGPESDIDIMVEIDSEARIGLWQYAGVVSMLEEMFAVKVDVANRATLKPHVRPSAERDAIYAF